MVFTFSLQDKDQPEGAPQSEGLIAKEPFAVIGVLLPQSLEALLTLSQGLAH